MEKLQVRVVEFKNDEKYQMSLQEGSFRRTESNLSNESLMILLDELVEDENTIVQFTSLEKTSAGVVKVENDITVKNFIK